MYIGNLTRNPMIRISHGSDEYQDRWCIINILVVLEVNIMVRIIRSIGNDAVIVYIIKYILAWIRSG